jgi:periplasmic copper chaperone A
MKSFHTIGLCTLAATLFAAPVSAHVTVAPPRVAAGGFEELTFRCPNERPAAATIKLEVQLPQADPLAYVSVRPVPGWHVTVTTRKLAQPVRGNHGAVTTVVDTVTWSGGQIRPGEYQDFAILAGTMPRGVRALTFKAIQTYSNGEVVRWIERRNPGEAEPAHPAPVLQVR